MYNASLANEKILPGESKEVKLIVTKKMTENNIGLVANTAEIIDSYNEYGLSDVNSTYGNKDKSEEDYSSADLILSIKTGQVVETALIIIFTIALGGTATYLIARNVLNRKITIERRGLK